jgi:hypothetical protein
MVLEHQVFMQDLLTRLQYEATTALAKSDNITPIKTTTETLVRYLLFADEAPMAEPIKGGSDFTGWFEGRGPKDQQGRSLREFDLKTRLFKYPCSYLIYSPAFNALPRPARSQVYRRLWTILSGEDRDPAFGRIPDETKRAIREILIDTKDDLPAYWTL